MRLTSLFGMAVFAVGLGACSAQQVSQVATVAQQIQPALITACGVAMLLAPAAGPIAPFIIAGCGTADAIDKLAADPSSTAWVNGLVAKVQALNTAH